MYLLNNKKVNIDSPIVFKGVTYPSLRDASIRELLKVVEVEDPVYPDPKLYFWTENEDGSLNIAAKPAEIVEKQRISDEAQASQYYLDSTDYLFTVDKFATLTEERKQELITKREEARVAIRLQQSNQPLGV